MRTSVMSKRSKTYYNFQNILFMCTNELAQIVFEIEYYVLYFVSKSE